MTKITPTPTPPRRFSFAAIASAAHALVHGYERKPMEARYLPLPTPKPSPKSQAETPRQPLHVYPVLEARRRRATRRANRR